MMELIPTETKALKTIESGKVIQKDYFKRFIEYTETNPKTMKNYKTFLNLFIKYLKEKGIKQPTFETIHDYKVFLNEYRNPDTNKPLSEATKNQYFQAVKHFFKYLSAFGLYNNIAIGFKSFKVDDGRSKDTFTRNEIRTILSCVDTTTTKGKRDFAMLLLAINGGLRIIEIQRSNIEDIEELHGTKFLYIQGKGRTSKKEKIELQPETQKALEEYLATRPNAKKDEPLFTGTSNNQKGTRITENSISRLFKTILKTSGFDSKRLTSHSFRHTANSILYEETGNLFQTQRFARHKDPKTTEIYIHTQEKEKDHSEAIIFNSIFNENKSEVNKEAMKNQIDNLSNDQLKKLSIYLQTIWPN